MSSAACRDTYNRKTNNRWMREVSVLLYQSSTESRVPFAPRVALSHVLPGKPRQARRVMLVQTQAENAGAQEITRLLGKGLASRGYEVHHAFFFRKSDSFDEPPNTFYCSLKRPRDPLALFQMLWRLGRPIREGRPNGGLTFQHFGHV